MSTLAKILIALTVVLAVSVALLLRDTSGGGTSLLPDGGVRDDSSRLDRLEKTQDERYAELNAKLDRIASHLGEPKAKPARAPGFQMPRTEAEALARSQAVRARLEARVVSEPVEPQWALESSRNIEETLASQDIAEMGAEPPLHTDINCRSTMCRIEMVFDSPDHAADAGTVLNMGIADRLPYTQVLRETLPDGSTQVVVYAYRDKPGT